MFFFFNDTATTEIYTLSLHDALPIWVRERHPAPGGRDEGAVEVDVVPDEDRTLDELLETGHDLRDGDRKSTRLNSSHANISYAVFCLKKKKIYAALVVISSSLTIVSS